MPYILMILLSVWLVAGNCFAATKAAAVIDDGYAGKALQKIMASFKGNVDKRTEARVSLDGDGKLVQCKSVTGDASALCQSVKEAGSFGTPPYGVATDILITLMPAAEGAKATPTKTSSTPSSTVDASYSKYLSRVRRDLRNAMYIPEKTKPGTYHATVRLKCEPSGKILDSSIVKNSGDALLDKYVLQGIHRAGKIEALPKGMPEAFDVDFTLVR